MRKTLSLPALVTMLVLVVGSTPAAASPWQPNVPVNSGQFGVTITDAPPAVLPSFIDATAADGTNTLCQTDAATGPCNYDATGTTVGAEAILPVCTSDVQTNCVARLALGTDPSNLTPSTFVRQTTGPTFSGDPTRNLPQGSTVGLWTNPLLNGGGTTQYATDVVVHAHYQAGTFIIDSFNASVTPYADQTQSWQKPPAVSITNNSLSAVGGSSWGCAYTDTGICGAVQDFAPGTVASLSVRISNEVGGWFFGRLQNPSISVSPFGPQSNVITVSAQPEVVPGVDITASLSATDANTLALMKSLGLNANSPSPTLFAPLVYGSNTPTIIDAMRADANNAATGDDQAWNFGSFASEAAQNPCLSSTSTVLGIVTTDAMAYNGAPPTFTGGFLSYSVAGMHFQPDQVTPFLGSYSLVMRDSVADCLYGFPSGPLSGSVTIVDNASNDGTVATTSISDSGGWVSATVAGFEFSNPTILVKLTPQAVVQKVATHRLPSAPRGLHARTTTTTVLLQWRPPRSTGGLPIIGYEIFTKTRAAKFAASPVNRTLDKTLHYRVRNVKVGVVYDAVVRAVTKVGASLRSTEIAFRLK